MNKAKTIVSINLGNFGSTGNIVKGIHATAEKFGYDGISCYPENKQNAVPKQKDVIICRSFTRRVHERIGWMTGYCGCTAILSTWRMLKRIDPAILHLHNLHNNYLYIPMLFRYVRKKRNPVVWTLHDCWAFTGHCPHFTMAKCDKWKTGCHHCPSYRDYPASLHDNSKPMYKLKKKWFTGVENMTIVTPSQWLADLVRESYLGDYPVKIIHNGIDLSIFKPTPSDFREKQGIAEGKYMVLGVAFDWGKRKGLDVFVELAKRLDSQKYQIVLVGTNDVVDAQLPPNIISVHRTQSQTELAEIYTAADVFVNPTREDNFPTVNLEALACGTPVLTFDTGGSPECIDENCGSVVDCEDVDGMEQEIVRICQTKPYAAEACLAKAQEFDMNEKFREYIALYEVLNEQKQSY